MQINQLTLAREILKKPLEPLDINLNCDEVTESAGNRYDRGTPSDWD